MLTWLLGEEISPNTETTPSATTSDQWQAYRTRQDMSSSIRQDAAWPSLEYGTVPGSQPMAWQLGPSVSNFNDPQGSLLSPNYGMNQYVNSMVMERPHPAYPPHINTSTRFPPQQGSALHRESTSDCGLPIGYTQGTRNEPFTRSNH